MKTNMISYLSIHYNMQVEDDFRFLE